MKDLIKIGRGVFALLLVGLILLLSDLSNREKHVRLVNENFHVAIVHWIDAPVIEKVEKGIISGLSDRGLIDGRNLKINTYKASGDISMLNSIFNQIRSLHADLIFVSCTPALQSAIHNIKDIPVVFTAVSDPVLAGAGTDATHHLDNITGCNVECDFDAMCQLLTENAPNLKTLGSIYCPGEIISVKFKDEFSRVAAAYGLSVKFFPANSAAELPDAILSMCSSNIDAVCQMGDNLMGSGIPSLIKGVVNADLPYFDFNARPEGTRMESLIQLDLDYFENGYDAAVYAAEILLDKKSPADLPFKSPSKTILEINPVKAKKYGIEFTEAVRQRADLIVGEKSAFNPPVNLALVHFCFSPDCDDVETGIIRRLTELGHKQDVDFTFTTYNANGDMATLNSIVNVVADKEYDLIFSTILVTTQALSAKIKDVPILFTVVADPVGNGLGKSYSDHIANLTGIDGMSYTDKGINLLKKYIPDVRNVGLLYSPGEMASVSGLEAFKNSCKKLQIKVHAIPVNSVSEVSDASLMLCSKNIDAICQMPDTYTIPGFSSIVKVSRNEKVPLFCFITSQVEMGAIAAIAGDYVQQGVEIADIAIRVINGVSPSEIPFSRIKQIKTVINPKASEVYGLETTQEIYDMADHIVREDKRTAKN